MNGFYAGSFDPITNGHLYVIKSAAWVFDEVVVGIGVNEDKRRSFAPEVMKETLEKVLVRENLANVRVVVYDNLTVEQAKKEHCQFLIRGLRDGVDYGEEETLARTNLAFGGLETIYFRAGEMAYISSSVVMELAKYRADVGKLVPIEISKLIESVY